MPHFRYRAINNEGKIISGTYSSTSERGVENKLNSLNMELLSCKEDKPLFGFIQNRNINRRDIINYCFYLEQMTRSGIPIVEALTDLQESTSPSYLSEVIGVQITEIHEGKSFSDSLKSFPEIFSDSFVSLILAGEKSGELVHVLKDLTQSLIWQDELIVQTKKALMMPAFVGCVVFAVVFFLMVFLVPELVSFMTMMGEEIPLNTRILIAVSNFFVQYWYLILIIPTIIFIASKQIIKRNDKVKYWFDHYKLKCWILGPIMEKVMLARFVNYLALLYNSGIPIIDCLKITESVVDNSAVESALVDIRKMIEEGATIGLAFELGNIFPKLVLSMINVGEKTGDIGTSLLNVSYFYKRDVDDAIESMQQMIEPMMTVVMGAIIGWVMISVLGPIYDLISNIQM